MVRLLALDSSPLSTSIVQTLALLGDNFGWNTIDRADAVPSGKDLPSYCLSLCRDTALAILLLRRGIPSYGLPSGCLRLVRLLDLEEAPSTILEDLTPRAASEWLHDWINSAAWDESLQRVIDGVLLPLARLGYLERTDFSVLLEPSTPPFGEVCQIQIAFIRRKLSDHSND